MRSLLTLSGLVVFLFGALAAPTFAQSSTYGADLVNDINGLEEKIVGLAEAIPEDKYSWRPSEGVRSVSEALMHAAQANFFFPTTAGIDPPEGIAMGTLEQITAKDEVVSTLKKSFDQIRKMVESTSAEAMGETKKVFGQDMTNAGVLHAAVSHSHEHLGQMIAYARSIGVTPPWSQ